MAPFLTQQCKNDRILYGILVEFGKALVRTHNTRHFILLL